MSLIASSHYVLVVFLYQRACPWGKEILHHIFSLWGRSRIQRWALCFYVKSPLVSDIEMLYFIFFIFSFPLFTLGNLNHQYKNMRNQSPWRVHPECSISNLENPAYDDMIIMILHSRSNSWRIGFISISSFTLHRNNQLE